MSTSSIMRVAARAAPSKTFFRAYRPAVPGTIAPGFFLSSTRNFSSTVTRRSGHEETFEEFTARYEKEFEAVQDVFELQRNLNNAFAYDLVPSPSVCEAAIKAARRVNDYPTAVRVFEGIKAKTENKGQYEEYLAELKPLREELGIVLKEDMYPEESK